MRLILSALVTLTALALPSAARADTLDDFVVSGHGLTLEFSLPSNPTPDGRSPHEYFYLGDLSFTENGTAMVADAVYFYTRPDGGGFDLEDADGTPIDNLTFFGPKLFTGPVRNPTFKIGDFKLRRGDCSAVSESADAESAAGCVGKYTVSITPESPSAVTPEPASLLLLGTGALSTLGMLRRRFVR